MSGPAARINNLADSIKCRGSFARPFQRPLQWGTPHGEPEYTKIMVIVDFRWKQLIATTSGSSLRVYIRV